MAFRINTALNFFRPAVQKQTDVGGTAVRTGAQILKVPTVKPSEVIDTVDFSKPYASNLAEKKLRDTYGGLEGAITRLVHETSSLQESITQRSKTILEEASTIRASQFSKGGTRYHGMFSGIQNIEEALARTLERAGGPTDKYTAASIISRQAAQRRDVKIRDHLQENVLSPMINELRQLKGKEYVEQFLDSIYTYNKG